VVGQGVPPLLPFAHGERQIGVEHGGQAVDERHLGHQGGEELGGSVGHRSDEEPPGGPAAPGQRIRTGDALCHEVPCAGDEVTERVGLVFHPPVLVPRPTHLAPAAHVCHGEDHAPVEQREPVMRERRIDGDLVGAVSVEEAGRR